MELLLQLLMELLLLLNLLLMLKKHQLPKIKNN
jgi:hypothetical protein